MKENRYLMRFYSQLVRKQSQKNGGNQSQQEDDEWRKYRTKVSEFTFFAQGNQLSAHVTVKLNNMGQTVFTHLQDEDGQSQHSNKQRRRSSVSAVPSPWIRAGTEAGLVREQKPT